MAYQRFFKKRSEFPKFKSKKSKNSFTVPQNTKVKDDVLYVVKFSEGIKFIKDRKIQGLIKKCTISKTPTNKYFVSILVEKEIETKQKTNKEIAIDLGLKDFLVLSDGSKIKNHRFLKHYERSLKLNQKYLSRKEKGSNRYERQRLKVTRIYEKISNCKIDLLQKVSTQLIEKYDVIYLEDLNIKGMSKRCKIKQDDNGKYLHNGQLAKSGLNKSILDACWGKFISMLEYKADWNDKEIIHVDRFFPSSKTCNSCGWINSSLTLKDREWICPKCGATHDRDVNAATNILNEGCRLKNISVGTTDHGREGEVRPDFRQVTVESSKAQEIVS